MTTNSLQLLLLAQLSEIRRALLDGNVSSLEGLAARVEELSLQLASLNPGADVLKELRLAAECNLPLLNAARRGFSDAMKRRQMLQGGTPALRTYNSAGQVSEKAASHVWSKSFKC